MRIVQPPWLGAESVHLKKCFHLGPVSVHSFHELTQKESPTILKQARGIKTREGWANALAADDTQVEALTLTIPNPRRISGRSNFHKQF